MCVCVCVCVCVLERKRKRERERERERDLLLVYITESRELTFSNEGESTLELWQLFYDKQLAFPSVNLHHEKKHINIQENYKGTHP